MEIMEITPEYLRATMDHDSTLYRWVAAMDNYEPTREFESFYAVEHIQPASRQSVNGVKPGWTIYGVDRISNPFRSNYILDFGTRIVVAHVAGWNLGYKDRVIVHPFPTASETDVMEDGSGRPLDYDTWQLGPRRAYHMKMTQAE